MRGCNQYAHVDMGNSTCLHDGHVGSQHGQPCEAALGRVQGKLAREGGSMSAPDTPAADGYEAVHAVAQGSRQRKRKDPDVVDERSERMQKRMVQPLGKAV